jgi:hypothetical protein
MTENNSTTSHQPLAPVDSIPIPNLVQTPLLKLSTYNTLFEAPEFQDLTDLVNTSTAWVCPALAAFLHALDALGDSANPGHMLPDSPGDANNLFNQVLGSEHLGPITSMPEAITEKEAMSMIKGVRNLL